VAKIVDLKSEKPERTNLAAEVAPKLESARTRLAELERHLSAAALAATLDEPGAADRLATLNDRLDVARRDVTQLEGAHRLAIQRDAAAQAAIEAKARQAELTALQAAADARLKAMVETCRGLETAAKAYTRFVEATAKMALALPTGQIPHAINWSHADIMIDGRVFPAALDVVVAGEMFRHAVGPQDALPGSRPPTEGQRLRPAAIEPAAEAVRRMNEYLVGTIREKYAALERADAVRLAKSA
jgi:hypothetical protein